MIYGKNIIWQKDLEGEITRVNINKNGYVSVIVSQNPYKSVIITLSPQGNELFKAYISDSYAIDSDISNDNKYLAVAEIDTNGTVIQSGIRIWSMEEIESGSENSTIYQKSDNTNKMITAIKYNDANNLIAMYDDKIQMIKDGQETDLIEFNIDTLFANIELNRAVLETKQVTNEERKNTTKTNILNTINNSSVQYMVEAIPKEVLVNKNTIAINTGIEVYFIKDNGWLKKKYVSKQEIKEIVLGENLAGIVYKNKINIVKL